MYYINVILVARAKDKTTSSEVIQDAKYRSSAKAEEHTIDINKYIYKLLSTFSTVSGEIIVELSEVVRGVVKSKKQIHQNTITYNVISGLSARCAVVCLNGVPQYLDSDTTGVSSGTLVNGKLASSCPFCGVYQRSTKLYKVTRKWEVGVEVCSTCGTKYPVVFW